MAGKDGSGEDTEFAQLRAVKAPRTMQGFWAEGKEEQPGRADTGGVLDTGGESCGPFPRGLQEVKPVVSGD